MCVCVCIYLGSLTRTLPCPHRMSFGKKRSNTRGGRKNEEEKKQNPSSIMVALLTRARARSYVPASASTMYARTHTRCSNSLHLRVPINNESASVPPFFLGCNGHGNNGNKHDEHKKPHYVECAGPSLARCAGLFWLVRRSARTCVMCE